MAILRRRLSKVLHKDLLVDLDDRITAEALKAFEMVRDRAGLNTKRSRELEGQARFRMMEQGFQEVCELHGGRLLEGGVLPLTDLKVFQPFMRFGEGRHGVIFGLAAMPEPKTIPGRNKSRLAGVSLNFHLTPRLALDDSGPKFGDLFALLLVSRDRTRVGKIEEIAIGVIGSNYEAFLFYETLDEFLKVKEPPKLGLSKSKEAKPPSPRAVKLKKDAVPFIPPELPKKKDDDDK